MNSIIEFIGENDDTSKPIINGTYRGKARNKANHSKITSLVKKSIKYYDEGSVSATIDYRSVNVESVLQSHYKNQTAIMHHLLADCTRSAAILA